MKTYLDKIHKSEVYALDQTIKVWKKILDKKEALIKGETSLDTLKFIYANSTTMRSNCFLCEHYGTCEDCVLKGCYTGEGIYKNIQKSIAHADGVMLELWIERLINKCYARIRELTEIRRIELCLKYSKAGLVNEEDALIITIDIYLYLQYHTEAMLRFVTLTKAKIALFPFLRGWAGACPLCEYYERNCDQCVLKSCNGGSIYEQVYRGYRMQDLYKIVSGCADIIKVCHNRLEELEEEND